MKTMIKPVVKTTTYNNTDVDESVIQSYKVLATAVNVWRGRNIVLHECPEDQKMLYSIGTTFDGSMVVIAREERIGWSIELDYAAHGKVYRRE